MAAMLHGRSNENVLHRKENFFPIRKIIYCSCRAKPLLRAMINSLKGVGEWNESQCYQLHKGKGYLYVCMNVSIAFTIPSYDFLS